MVPCDAVFSVHQNLPLQGHHLCVLCVPYCCGSATFDFSPIMCNSSLCLLGEVFGPCVVNRPVRGHLELELGQIGCLPELWSH